MRRPAVLEAAVRSSARFLPAPWSAGCLADLDLARLASIPRGPRPATALLMLPTVLAVCLLCGVGASVFEREARPAAAERREEG